MNFTKSLPGEGKLVVLSFITGRDGEDERTRHHVFRVKDSALVPILDYVRLEVMEHENADEEVIACIFRCLGEGEKVIYTPAWTPEMAEFMGVSLTQKATSIDAGDRDDQEVWHQYSTSTAPFILLLEKRGVTVLRVAEEEIGEEKVSA